MSRGLLIAFVVFVCVLGVAIPAGATPGSEFIQEEIDPDDVLLTVSVDEDGDAAWQIEYRLRLDTDERRASFEDIRTDIESDPDPYAQQFHDRMNATAETAEETTDRSMAITGMAVTAEKRELPQEYGVVTYSFQWTNFAAVDGDRLVVGDAIAGMFLDEQTTLIVSWSDEFGLSSVTPEPSETRESSVVYTGERNFGGDEPRIELASAGESPADTGWGLPVSPLVLAALLVLLVIGGAGVIAYRRHRSVDDDGTSGTDQQTDTAEDKSTAGDGSASAGGQSDATDQTDVDPALLSNEEQVLRLIEQEGGRMKQKEVAERLDWTDAKTSQVTKQLREDGTLDGFRLGRENVLSLPDETVVPDESDEN